jgi:hypothetical protein
VQIDLYKAEGDSLSDSVFVGSLILENIQDSLKGEPEIELIVGIDEMGNLNAAAGDAATGERQSLSLSLDALEEEGEIDLPSFDMDTSIEPSSDVTSFEDEGLEDFGDFGEENAEFSDEPGHETETAEQAPERQRRLRPGLLAVFVFLGLAIVGLLAFLIYRSFQGVETPPLQARGGSDTELPVDGDEVNRELSEFVGTGRPGGEKELTEDADIITLAEPDEGTAVEKSHEAEKAEETSSSSPRESDEPEGRRQEHAAVEEQENGETRETAQEPEKGKEPRIKSDDRLGGVWYWIKWGDTLWDLSNSFYRTPHLYGKIARENNIANPHRIYAESKIFIPEK